MLGNLVSNIHTKTDSNDSDVEAANNDCTGRMIILRTKNSCDFNKTRFNPFKLCMRPFQSSLNVYIFIAVMCV